MALPGKKAKLTAYSEPISFTGETASSTDDETYIIDDSTKRIWCRECTITVFDGGTEVDPSNYTLNRLEGAVIFDTASTRDITIDGQYLQANDTLQAYEYTYTLDASNEDSTVFESEFIQRTQALKDFTASISRYYDGLYFFNRLDQNQDFVVEFYSDNSASPDVKARVKISSAEPSAAVDGLIEESIELEGTTDADGRAVSFGLS